MSTAIRRVRITPGERGLLRGAHVTRLVRPHDPQRDPRLVQLAAVAGMVAEAAADAGEV